MEIGNLVVVKSGPYKGCLGAVVEVFQQHRQPKTAYIVSVPGLGSITSYWYAEPDVLLKNNGNRPARIVCMEYELQVTTVEQLTSGEVTYVTPIQSVLLARMKVAKDMLVWCFTKNKSEKTCQAYAQAMVDCERVLNATGYKAAAP